MQHTWHLKGMGLLTGTLMLWAAGWSYWMQEGQRHGGKRGKVRGPKKSVKGSLLSAQKYRVVIQIAKPDVGLKEQQSLQLLMALFFIAKRKMNCLKKHRQTTALNHH